MTEARQTVLIVDDSPDGREMLAEYLTFRGFDVIEAIRSYDTDHHTDFLITLRVYLDANGNVAKTAKRLHVHGNTVRYRIVRLAEDFGVDLEESATRLWLWLRLVSHRGEGSGDG